jgi:hypothetical protein
MKQPSVIPAKKKPYQPPKLLVYGDLAQMTKAVGRAGRIDGGSRSGKVRTGG